MRYFIQKSALKYRLVIQNNTAPCQIQQKTKVHIPVAVYLNVLVQILFPAAAGGDMRWEIKTVYQSIAWQKFGVEHYIISLYLIDGIRRILEHTHLMAVSDL